MYIKTNIDLYDYETLEKVKELLKDKLNISVTAEYDDETIDQYFCCPNCGDSEFWDREDRHCNHCGYSG